MDQKSVVYTDEHGEARVTYLPGTDFFFLNLPGVAINANGGCDLANVSTLGTANVSATVRYPFEPVTARPVTSNVITKTVTSAFSKSITCYPKGAQAEEQNAAICVAEAHDITGAPVVGETVCFFADFNAEDIQYFAGSIPNTNITIGDEGRNSAAEAQGLRRVCPYTDANGRAAVEVFNSNPTTVDVQALFVDEGILRSIHVTFPITAKQGPATGVKSQTPTSTPPVTTPPSSTPPSSTPPAVKVKIASIKVTRVSRTKATVQLKVSGPAGKVPVRIRFAAVGKVAKGSSRTISVVRVVKTNATVTLRNLRTPNAKKLTTKASLIS
jgi:hypothetical protein